MISCIVLFAILSLTANVNSQTIVGTYDGVLDSTDGVYDPSGGSGTYYYEAIRIIVDTNGDYDLSSSAVNNIDTHGYLYNDPFDPQNPSLNWITHDDDAAGNNQFRITYNLQAGVPYVLVVTSHTPSITGSFTAMVAGPGNSQLTQIDPLFTTMTSTDTDTTMLTSVFNPSYSGVLSVNDRNYTRYGIQSGTFYYHAIEVRVSTTGTYTFRTSSSIADTYGYLYQGNFYPDYPQYNMITSDDDGSGTNQFALTADLRPDLVYILIFTTYAQLATGSYDITATGPGSVAMIPM